MKILNWKKRRSGTEKLGPLSLKVKKRRFDKALGQGLTINLFKSNYYWKGKDTREKRWAGEGTTTGAGHSAEANTKTENTRQCKLEALNSSRRWRWCRWETNLREKLDLSAKLSACRGQKYSNWTKSWKKPLLKAKDKSESTCCQKYQLQKRKNSNDEELTSDCTSIDVSRLQNILPEGQNFWMWNDVLGNVWWWPCFTVGLVKLG